MKNRTIYMQKLVTLLVTCSLSALSQKAIDPDKIVAFNVTVNFDEYTVKTQMLKDPKKVKVDNNLSYLWYTSNKIIETKGGYDGKLLHGYYKSFYLNNQLRESGEIKYGTKHHEWRNWYSDGKLKEVSTWKNGRKNGKYELYNDYGHLMAQGTFKNDLLHGRFYTYDNFGRIADIKKYKNGNEVVPKQKKQKVKKEPKEKTKKETQKDSTVSKEKKKTIWQKFKGLFKKKDKKQKHTTEDKSNKTEPQ